MAPTVVRFTTAIIANVLLAATATTAKAQTQTLFRADDGTAYQVLRTIPPLGLGATHVTFTSIGGSASGVGSCLGPGSADGDLVSAVGGANPAEFQALHPYNQIVRTAILVPNDITTLTFDEREGGRVSLGISNADCIGAGAPLPCCTDAGTGTCQALDVCKNASDCMGQPDVQGTMDLDVASPGVPAACIANGATADCEIPITRNTFAFGLAATGSPPVCTTPADVTVNSMICDPAPTDGFTLDDGGAIVFIYDSSLACRGFTGVYGGFLTSDTFEAMDICPASETNRIVAAAAEIESSSSEGCPTTTPTEAGPSSTPTATPTQMVTSTPSSITTPTLTTINTATPTPSPALVCAKNPQAGCRAAGTSVLFIKQTTDATMNKLVWRWSKGAATDLSALGNPVTGTTIYHLCIYGSTGGTPGLALRALIPAASMCGGGLCWRPSGSKGFNYSDSAGQADGIIKVVLRTGTNGNAKVLLKGTGANLPAIVPANMTNLIAQDPTVTVQLVNSDGQCWESVYEAPATKATGISFRDKF